tara:strand:- start:3626 stop:5425 length:1800 start_codon:yes stop_codon:yes gene_type:complete
MKKINLIWIFVILFSFLALDGEAVLCSKTVDDLWCMEVDDESYCDPEYGTVDAYRCEPVCCVGAEGECTSFMPREECLVNGGSPVGNGACYRSGVSFTSECERGVCDLAGDISTVTREQCNYQASERGLSSGEYGFNTAAQNEAGAARIALEDSSRGCCVESSGSCSYTKESSCVIGGGDFNVGKFCSDPSLIDTCPQCQGAEEEECSRDASAILRKNSCGQILETTTCPEHKYCVEENSEVKCVSYDCSAGDTIVFPKVNIGGGQFVSSKRGVKIDDTLLGGVNKRKNGESWCMISGHLFGDGTNKDHDVESPFLPKHEAIALYGDELWKHSAGLSFHKFSCQNGVISQDQCGGAFRDEICVTKSELEYIANTRSNEDILYCLNNQVTKSYYNKLDFDLENDGNILYVNSPAFHNDNYWEEGICKENKENIIKDCRASFPIGSFFYQPTVANPSLDQAVQPSQCNHCGDGFWNVCGGSECRKLDDCTAEGPGFGKVAKNCAKYALIFEAMWLTAGSLSGGMGAEGALLHNPGWGGPLGTLGLAGKAPAEMKLTKAGKALNLLGTGIKYSAPVWAATTVSGDIRKNIGDGGEPEYQPGG